jgi:hypothetical protein
VAGDPQYAASVCRPLGSPYESFQTFAPTCRSSSMIKLLCRSLHRISWNGGRRCERDGLPSELAWWCVWRITAARHNVRRLRDDKIARTLCFATDLKR